jgi:hypothetical protein
MEVNLLLKVRTPRMNSAPSANSQKGLATSPTSRNGGWTREGKTLFNELCRRVKEDRQTDRGAFAKVCRAHRACLHGKKRKRLMVDGAQHHITISDDLEDLWSAAATETCAI